MRNLVAVLVLLVALAGAAKADVWKWVDVDGRTHFVDTTTPIYTWTDPKGNVHYSDTPDHEGSVSVELVWVSKGTLQVLQAKNDEPESDGFAYPGETPDERAEREKAEAYYCNQATEVYESYVNAPRLYTTNSGGAREFLDEDAAKKLISETLARVEDLCN